MTGQDQELTRKQKRRLAEFIAPFKVEPGSRVRLSQAFDPSSQRLHREEHEGVALLEKRSGRCPSIGLS